MFNRLTDSSTLSIMGAACITIQPHHQDATDVHALLQRPTVPKRKGPAAPLPRDWRSARDLANVTRMEPIRIRRGHLELRELHGIEAWHQKPDKWENKYPLELNNTSFSWNIRMILIPLDWQKPTGPYTFYQEWFGWTWPRLFNKWIRF